MRFDRHDDGHLVLTRIRQPDEARRRKLLDGADRVDHVGQHGFGVVPAGDAHATRRGITVPQGEVCTAHVACRKPLQIPRVGALVIEQLDPDLVLLAHRVLASTAPLEQPPRLGPPELGPTVGVERPFVVAAAARATIDEPRRPPVGAQLDVVAAELRQHELRRSRADAVVRLEHGGQGRLREGSGLQPIEPDDGQIVRHVDAEVGQAFHAADRVAIRREQERGDGHAGGDELLGNVATTELTVVERGEEPLRLGSDAMRRQGHAIRIVAGTHVGLNEIAREADAGVVVTDQMVDGVAHTGEVVGSGRWGIEPVDLVTGQRHCLAGRLQPIEVVALRRRGDRDDAVEVLPSRRRHEIGCGHDLVAAEPGIERLDQHDTATDGGSLTGDAGKDRAVVDPAGHRRENPDRDDFRHAVMSSRSRQFGPFGEVRAEC